MTLGEILVALTLATALVMVLALSVPLSIKSLRQGQTHVTAQHLARHYLEWWSMRAFQQLKNHALDGQSEVYHDPVVGDPPPPPSPQQFASLVSPDAGAFFTTTVAFSTTDDPNLIRLDVTVDWNSGPQMGMGYDEVHYASQVYNAFNPW